MSDEAAKPAKNGGKKKKMLIILGAVLLLGGGGAAAGFFAAGSMSQAEGPKEDPNMPRLVKKGENPEDVAALYAAAEGEHGGEGDHGAKGGKPHHGVDMPRPKNPADYQATYYQLPQPFTSNLSDSDAFAQISIAAATYYDSRVTKALESHELALRSEILMMLAEEQELELATPAGKEKLQGKLIKIVNKVLKEKTGYGGVDNVYFTNFVIQ